MSQDKQYFYFTNGSQNFTNAHSNPLVVDSLVDYAIAKYHIWMALLISLLNINECSASEEEISHREI